MLHWYILLRILHRSQVLMNEDSSLEQLVLTQALSDASTAIGAAYKGRASLLTSF